MNNIVQTPIGDLWVLCSTGQATTRSQLAEIHKPKLCNDCSKDIYTVVYIYMVNHDDQETIL